MKIKHIRLTNFCKHRSLETDLFDRTEIAGHNETGKSTIKRAIYWIFNLKDENGKEITGIRPHDKDGKDIIDDNVPTEVELELDNGVMLKKSYGMAYNRKNEPQGYVTSCYINGIVQKPKEYAEHLKNMFPNESCVNPQTFFKLDAAKRRDLIEKVFGNRKNAEIVDMFPEFEPIRSELEFGTVAQIKQTCNDKIHGSKTRNVVGYEQRLNEIVGAIKENEEKREEIDVAELELARNALKEQLAEVKSKQDDLSAQLAEIDKASDGILELKFKVNDLVRQANEENIKARQEIERLIGNKKFLLQQTQDIISDTENDISNSIFKIESYRVNISNLRGKYKETQRLEFDENSLVCSYCGQEYPKEKQDELRAEFESHKAEELKTIEEKGKRLKSEIEVEQEKSRTLELELAEHKKSLEMLNTAIADLENQLAALPQSVDLSDRADIAELNRQIADKEKFLQESNSFSEIREKLQSEEESIREQLSTVEKQIAKSENNTAIDERIAELQTEQRKIAQEIADQEQILYYLSEFEKTKNKLLEQDINGAFQYIQFDLFETLINGNTNLVCEPKIDGESYYRNLNHGNRILAEIDICLGFQNAYGVNLPIIIEDTESIDLDKIPETDRQVIMIRRTNDKELIVKEVE
jgi:hypothetical protein